MSSLVNIQLLGIDVQQDFMDLPGSALPVPGAVEDSKRMAALVRRLGRKISDIHITFDSHHLIHIANPIMWVNSMSQHPAPFTQISVDDVANGVWRAYKPGWQKWQAAYVESLANQGRYKLTIWPPHCLIGSMGYAIEPNFYGSLIEWEANEFGMVNKVTKGSNYRTEHYSAVKAEVQDPNDPTTGLNIDLVRALSDGDIILLGGQALSHCLASTVRDIADYFGPTNVEKLHLLRDCTSPVPGFEQVGEDFIQEMVGRGMKVVNSVDFLA